METPNRDHQHGGVQSVGEVSQRIKHWMRASDNWDSLSLAAASPSK